MKKLADYFKKFNAFLHEDSWTSFLTTLLIAFFLIKFLFFPGLSLITGTDLPLVIVESCSMYHHEPGFKNMLTNPLYEKWGISIDNTSNWIFPNGFSKGDVIFVIGAKDIKIGDVIIFNAGASHPLIHRVVKADEFYGTKGDNYITNHNQIEGEKKISKEQIIGKALFKIPAIGWAKLIFFEPTRSAYQRGTCR